MPRLWSGAVWWWMLFFCLIKQHHADMQHLQMFHFCRVLAVGPYSCLPFSCVMLCWFSLGSCLARWRLFFPPHWRVFFFLFTSPFAFLEGVAGLGLLGISLFPVLDRLEALKPGFFQHWGCGFWLCMWGIFKCSIWIHLIWLRSKHIPNFLKAFGYIEYHRIISPNRADELPIERWTPSRNMCFWLCKTIKTSGCKPSLRP